MNVAPLGEPDAAKVARLGSAGRGWCSWETKTWPLTRLLNRKFPVDHQQSIGRKHLEEGALLWKSSIPGVVD
jgi:hypothetical protein